MKSVRQMLRVADPRLGGRQTSRRSDGVTMLELLVVILIVMLISTVVLRSIVPALKARGTREGARLLSVAINAARNRAMETGRPAGIWIERMTGLPEAAVSVATATTPPPYSGNYMTSRLEGYLRYETIGSTTYVINVVRPMLPNGSGGWRASTPQEETWASASLSDQQFIRTGDQLRVNYSPYPFTLQSSDDTLLKSKISPPVWIAAYWTTGDSPPDGQRIITRDNPMPYQILRQPIKSAAGLVQMPEGIVIDLNYSGPNADRSFHPRTNGLNNGRDYGIGRPEYPEDNSPIILMFKESGVLDCVYCRMWNSTLKLWTWSRDTSLNPVYFLIGQRANLPLPADTIPGSSVPGETVIGTNMLDPNNVWVLVAPFTGGVVTSPCDYVPSTTVSIQISIGSNGQGIFTYAKLDRSRAQVNARSDLLTQ